MITSGRTFFSSNYLKYSIQLVSSKSRVTLNPIQGKVSVDNLVHLDSQISNNELRGSEEFCDNVKWSIVGAYTWNMPFLYLYKTYFIDSSITKF
jgi:hypothetical protein